MRNLLTITYLVLASTVFCAVSSTAQTAVPTVNAFLNWNIFSGTSNRITSLTITPLPSVVPVVVSNVVLNPKTLNCNSLAYPLLLQGILTNAPLVPGFKYGITNTSDGFGFFFNVPLAATSPFDISTNVSLATNRWGYLNLYGVARGIGSPDGSVTVTPTNNADGTFSYGLKAAAGGGGATNVIGNVVGTNGVVSALSTNGGVITATVSLDPAATNGMRNAAYGDTNTMTVFAATNADFASSLLTQVSPINITGPLWNPYSQGQFRTPPKGVNFWFGGGGITPQTEQQVIVLVSNMVANGMVANGYNTILLDGGSPAYPYGGDSPFPAQTNDVPYPALTNGVNAPWLDFDTNYFPHGAPWLISMCHSNGVRVFFYAFNGNHGGNVQSLGGTNFVTDAQPGLFGASYYFQWLSNAIVNWHLDGIKDEASGNIVYYTNAILQSSVIASATEKSGSPFYVNVASFGYRPYFRGLFNSWRVGVGLFGDVTTLSTYYQWLDVTPFWVSSPGNINDLDDMTHALWYGVDTANNPVNLVKNEMALDSIANAAMLNGIVDISQKYTSSIQGCFYEDYDNPLINRIDNDFANSLTVVSNNLLVAYSRTLADGTIALAVQNRSTSTAQNYTIKNPFPAQPVFTVHDCFMNAPIAVATNSYTFSTDRTNVTYLNIVPGIEQVFSAGTNAFELFPWATNYVTYTGSPLFQIDNWPANYQSQTLPYVKSGETNNTIFVFAAGNSQTNFFTWNVNGNGTLLKFQLSTLYDGNCGEPFSVIGDGKVLFTTNKFTASMDVSIPISGVTQLTISAGNTNNDNVNFALGTPQLICNSQTRYDTLGNYFSSTSQAITNSLATTNYVTDTNITTSASATAGQILTYSATLGKYWPSNAPAGGGGSYANDTGLPGVIGGGGTTIGTNLTTLATQANLTSASNVLATATALVQANLTAGTNTVATNSAANLNSASNTVVIYVNTATNNAVTSADDFTMGASNTLQIATAAVQTYANGASNTLAGRITANDNTTSNAILATVANASLLTSGTVADARLNANPAIGVANFTGTLPAINGNALTNIPYAKTLSGGTNSTWTPTATTTGSTNWSEAITNLGMGTTLHGASAGALSQVVGLDSNSKFTITNAPPISIANVTGTLPSASINPMEITNAWGTNTGPAVAMAGSGTIAVNTNTWGSATVTNLSPIVATLTNNSPFTFFSETNGIFVGGFTNDLWDIGTNSLKAQIYATGTTNTQNDLSNVLVFIPNLAGTVTGSAIGAGIVGEKITSAVASGSAVSLTTATAANVTSISLTAGNWAVSGNINFSDATATSTGTSASINTTTATMASDGTEAYSGVQVTLVSEIDSVTLPVKVINVSTTTTVYLVGKSTFSAGSVSAFGSITATRMH